MHKFGYYEIRCKLPQNDGWHAAFWLQSPSIGAHPNPKFCGVECDIMENYRRHTKGTIGCGCGWGGYCRENKWHGHFWFPNQETAEGRHSYGVDGSPAGYIFYADGKEVGKQMAPEYPISEVDQFILVSTECHGYHRSINRGGLETKDQNGWDPESEVLHNETVWRWPGGRERARYRMRLYTAGQIGKMLDLNGLDVENIFGEFDGRPLAPDTSPARPNSLENSAHPPSKQAPAPLDRDLRS